MNQIKRSTLLSSTLIVSVFSIANLLSGFLLQIVLASGFGASATMDAYLAASTIPITINLILVGALNVAVVPLLIDYRIHHGDTEAWKIINSGLNGFIILTVISMAIFGFFAEQVIVTIAPGLAQQGTVDSASQLFIFLLPSNLFIGLSGFLASVYYSHKKFLIPSLAFAINNLVLLLFVFIFSPNLGMIAVPIGTVLGAICQFLITVPIIFGKYKPIVYYEHAGVWRLVALVAPWICGNMIGKMNPLVERWFASNFAEGAISHLGYAFLGITAVTVVTNKGIAVSLLPLISEHASKKQVKQLVRLSSKVIRLLLLILALVAMWLILGSRGMVKILFERGAFTSDDTLQVSMLLVAYIGYYIFGSLGVIVMNIFYAMQDTVTALKISIIGFLIYLVLAFVLSRSFSVIGLAAATSIEYALNLFLLIWILRRRLGALDGRRIGLTFLKTAIAATIAIWLSWYTAEALFMGQEPIWLSYYIITSSVAFVLLLALLRTEELGTVWQLGCKMFHRRVRPFIYAK